MLVLLLLLLGFAHYVARQVNGPEVLSQLQTAEEFL